MFHLVDGGLFVQCGFDVSSGEVNGCLMQSCCSIDQFLKSIHSWWSKERVSRPRLIHCPWVAILVRRLHLVCRCRALSTRYGRFFGQLFSMRMSGHRYQETGHQLISQSKVRSGVSLNLREGMFHTESTLQMAVCQDITSPCSAPINL